MDELIFTCILSCRHGNGTEFSCRGIEICVDYFVKRGHSKITAFVPNFRKGHHSQVNRDILEKLHEKGYVVFTPSRRVGGRLVACYDDRLVTFFHIHFDLMMEIRFPVS